MTRVQEQGSGVATEFRTDLKYSHRKTKARYVWLKYESLLGGEILDVGADRCYLREYLSAGARYTGIGLGGQPDLIVNLEQGSIPFKDSSFDCVLCLDVLEHLDNPHFVFDELCRVSRDVVVISLPNPWNTLLKALQWKGEFGPGQSLKFYGLPPEPPEDRHKWFFSADEAARFIVHRAKRNDFEVVQMDQEGVGKKRPFSVKRAIRKKMWDRLFRGGFTRNAMFAGPTWAVLRKTS